MNISNHFGAGLIFLPANIFIMLGETNRNHIIEATVTDYEVYDAQKKQEQLRLL